MFQHILRQLRKLRPAHLLCACFLVYITMMAFAALPEFLHHFSNVFYWDTGYQYFIDTVNEQYEDMLTLEQDQPALQNKGTYINLNGLMAKTLGQPMMNECLLLKNGHLGFVPSEEPELEDIRQAAQTVIRFHDAHTATGGAFLFVMAPTQTDKYQDLMPAGYQDTTNGPADTFLAFLRDAGVPCLDLREELHKDGISVTDAFYTTDHHWTPETGFWAYGKILKKLEQMDAIAPVDPFYTDAGNYRFVTYEDTFLGSSGRRTGVYFGGLDDSTFIVPAFKTDISLTIPTLEAACRGPFEEVAYHQKIDYDFEDPDLFNVGFYGLYGWADNGLTHWRNEQAPDQSKFLLIGESFGNVPFSLMSIVLGICDEVDMRLFEGDFSDYYQSFVPDTVVLEFNASSVISDFTTIPYLD